MLNGFVVVNAFADGPFGGNPAAVFTQATGLNDETMAAIARQLNLVEIVFVLPGQGGADFRLRYFTPHGEIPIAGHPTVAAWLALLHEGIVDMKLRRAYRQVNLAGQQDIFLEPDPRGASMVTMQQPRPEFIDAELSADQVASTFGISVDDLVQDLPVKAVNTGLGHVIVPVRSLEGLMRVSRNIEPLKKLCAGVGMREAQLFCFEPYDKQHDLHTRNLCPREGLEDPACGQGNGALAAYLAKYKWPDKSTFSLRNEQGTVVDMKSVIHTRINRHADEIEVFVSGTGVVMLEGRFLV